MSSNGDVDQNGDIWFFTQASSHKVTEIEKLPKVNVSFADPDNQRYVSVSGAAQLVRDRTRIDELWRPEFKIWFPEGKDDPEIALLRVMSGESRVLGQPLEHDWLCLEFCLVNRDRQRTGLWARTRKSNLVNYCGGRRSQRPRPTPLTQPALAHACRSRRAVPADDLRFVCKQSRRSLRFSAPWRRQAGEPLV